jgi:hypothetical protein
VADNFEMTALLDPDRLGVVPPAEILYEIAQGRLQIDHRVLRGLLDRPTETTSALVDFAISDLWQGDRELEIDIAQLFHALGTPDGIPFLVEAVRRNPTEIADEVVSAIHFFAPQAVEPLLALYAELDKEESEEIAFLLATFHFGDERIFQLLKDRAAADLSEGAFLLGIHGDLNAREFLQEKLAELQETDSKASVSIAEALNLLENNAPATYEPVPIDIYSLYPEEAELPIDLLPEDDRLALLSDSRSSIRARAAQSFFNQHPGQAAIDKLLKVAQSDPDESVRARAWESLVDATEETSIVEAMLRAMRDPQTPVAERAGVLVGLSLETDRKEVRGELERFYQEHPEARAKALEAMWRSLHPSFRDYFVPHLDDNDLETRRNAVWGVGYYSIKPSLDKLRKLFDDQELRSDALFAYALALPNEISKGRVRGLLSRIEKDAGGLSEIEERLVMTALDERLMLSGKEPFFYPED